MCQLSSARVTFADSPSPSSKVAQAQSILLRYGRQTRGGTFFTRKTQTGQNVVVCLPVYLFTRGFTSYFLGHLLCVRQSLDPRLHVADPSQCVGVPGQGVLSYVMQGLLPWGSLPVLSMEA